MRGARAATLVLAALVTLHTVHGAIPAERKGGARLQRESGSVLLNKTNRIDEQEGVVEYRNSTSSKMLNDTVTDMLNSTEAEGEDPSGEEEAVAISAGNVNEAATGNETSENTNTTAEEGDESESGSGTSAAAGGEGQTTDAAVAGGNSTTAEGEPGEGDESESGSGTSAAAGGEGATTDAAAAGDNSTTAEGEPEEGDESESGSGTSAAAGGEGETTDTAAAGGNSTTAEGGSGATSAAAGNSTTASGSNTAAAGGNTIEVSSGSTESADGSTEGTAGGDNTEATGDNQASAGGNNTTVGGGGDAAGENVTTALPNKVLAETAEATIGVRLSFSGQTFQGAYNDSTSQEANTKGTELADKLKTELQSELSGKNVTVTSVVTTAMWSGSIVADMDVNMQAPSSDIDNLVGNDFSDAVDSATADGTIGDEPINSDVTTVLDYRCTNDPPEPMDNMRRTWSNNRELGSTASYTCFPGYELEVSSGIHLEELRSNCSRTGNTYMFPSLGLGNSCVQIPTTTTTTTTTTTPTTTTTTARPTTTTKPYVPNNISTYDSKYFFQVTLPAMGGILLALVVLLCCIRIDSPLCKVCADGKV